MRIAFFGLPLAAVLLASDGHEIVYAGLLRGPGLRRASTRLLPGRAWRFPDLADARVVAAVKAARPELIVSWFWTRPVPPLVLAIAPAIGMHPSLLPRHRGPDPYYWAIAEGDTVTGVTAHHLDERYDTGAVLARRTLPIAPSWNAWKLAKALDRPSLELLREMVRAHAAGGPPPGTPQDESLATSAPRPEEEDLALRWTWPAAKVERRVRAAAPWPGAWTEIGDQVVVVVRARETRDFPRLLAPGEAAVRADGVAVVRAADHAVELLEGRPEDEETTLGSDDLARVVASARA
ncbi:MAG: methionyl-tRNA formyltransferase [Polyangiaceae bacterium]